MAAADVILDQRGQVMFRCVRCGDPMTRADFFELKLRLPADGEDPDDYRSEELIDEFEHEDCSVASGVA